MEVTSIALSNVKPTEEMSLFCFCKVILPIYLIRIVFGIVMDQ